MFAKHIILLLALVVLITACASPTPAATAIQPTSAPVAAPTIAPTAAPTATMAPTATTAPTVAPTAAAVTLTDDANRKVTISGIPQRIISLAPSTTEIAFALGAGSRVVAVDAFSDYPESAKALPKVTQGFNYTYEQIVALKPDLVLAAGITAPEVIKKLEDVKLTVLVVGAPTQTFDSVEKDITLAGQALGATDQARQVIQGMEDKVAQVKKVIAGAKDSPKVYWELDATDPAKPYAPGSGAFLDDLIKMAGGTNVTATANQAYAQVNAEAILKANPDIIILSDAAYGTTPESVKARPGWNVINAVKNNKVFPIDDNLVSRPGPRLADGLLAAAKLIHPELFQSGSTGAGSTFADPFAYCAAVGNIDAPDAQYTGAKLPDAIANGLNKAMGTNMPVDILAKQSFWRCMGGKVYGCAVGANIPCQEKADTGKTPSAAMTDFCKANPTAIGIPAAVTGRATVYEWQCTNGTPTIVKQLTEPDARGFLAAFWYVINPN